MFLRVGGWAHHFTENKHWQSTVNKKQVTANWCHTMCVMRRDFVVPKSSSPDKLNIGT